MKLVLFGANGATGLLLTRQVIDAGHSALAVTRRPREFPFTDPQLAVAAADVRDESTLAGDGTPLTGPMLVRVVLGEETAA